MSTDILKKKRTGRVTNKNLDFIESTSSDDEKKIVEQYKQENKIKSQKQLLNTPWIEKYRPDILDDLVIDKSTKNKIEKINNEKNMPNIIITGVPGIGKTSTILCIAKCLLGKYFNQGVLELNASDDRGIKAVQDSVIYFCKKKMDIDNTTKKYAKHKIVLLDEADNMTKKAQQLVNNLMDKYHDTTKFAFTCNNSSDIIEAIQSRCIIFRYKRLNNEDVEKKLKNVCEKENVTYTKDGLDAIILTSQGDLRKAINNLQLIYNGYKNITPENVYKLCDKPDPIIIKNIFMACYEKNMKKALEHLQVLRDNGYSSSDISLSMVHTLKSPIITEIDELTRINFIKEISKKCLIITKGIDTPLQLTGCIAKMCL